MEGGGEWRPTPSTLSRPPQLALHQALPGLGPLTKACKLCSQASAPAHPMLRTSRSSFCSSSHQRATTAE